MCLLLFAWETHPRYRLILAGNRDEYHARPARAAHWWRDPPDLLAGRDEQAGGTWLGLGRGGRFAVVTNFREMRRAPAGTRSRGELVTGFIRAVGRPQEYATWLQAHDARYSGYNLLFADLAAPAPALHYATNRGNPAGLVGPGVHGLSNHLLDTPWPKVAHGRERFAELTATGEVPIEFMFDLLGDRRQAGNEQLPHTGLDTPTEKMLSAPFIVDPSYGTRCSTIVLAGYDGEMTFFERRFDPAGTPVGEERFRFSLAPER